MAANFRGAVKNISPAFLREGTGERYMYVFGLLVDAQMQKHVEAMLARMPTKCDPSFLPLIGKDRLIPQGLTEDVDSYRVRLQRAFESWQLAGSARGIMGQVLGYLLALTPQVRMVSSRYSGNVADLLFVIDASNENPIVITTKRNSNLKTGDTVTITGVGGNTNANTTATIAMVGPRSFQLVGVAGNASYTSGGVVASSVFPTVYPPMLLSSSWDTYAAGQDPKTAPVHVYQAVGGVVGANWDWDSVSQVLGSWGSWGAFMVLFAVAPNDFAKPATWLIGDPRPLSILGGTVGTNLDPKVMPSIAAIAGQFKAASTWIRWIIISFDATLFDPGAPDGGGVNPDGTFGWWHKLVAGNWVASRFSDARYCEGTS